MKKFFDLSKDQEQRALDLHKKCFFFEALDASWPKMIDREYFLEHRKAGVNGINFGSIILPWMTVHHEEFWQRIAEFERKLQENEDIVQKATTYEDILRAQREGKIAVIFGAQSPEMIDKDINLLRMCYDLGFRVIGLAYQHRNFIADGCGERTDSGLSSFGVKVVEEMNKLGIVIDLSHVGRMSTLDAIEVSKDPVIFTHSNPRLRSKHNRTLLDEQIKALAEKDGVLGLSVISVFIGDFDPQTSDWSVVPDATVEGFLDHVNYTINLVGVNHVGVGRDFADSVGGRFTWEDMNYGMWQRYQDLSKPLKRGEEKRMLIEGVRTAPELVNITRGLVARGYSDQEIEKILGGNFLKVFKSVLKK